MEVMASNVRDACELAMAHADDEENWRDTLISSTHWIENVDDQAGLVPIEHSAAAIRAGGAILLAQKLRHALASLVVAYEAVVRTGTHNDQALMQSKELLRSIPDVIGDD
ncbi:MAG TPA: hypothetical protein VFZ01_15725, partial [Geminicoccaceae bacterium]